MKRTYRFYKSRNIPVNTVIKEGSFNQDSRGRWYVNLIIDIPQTQHIHEEEEVGIDLGIKTTLTLSDGNTFSIPKFTKLKEEIAGVQSIRDKKKKSKKYSRKYKKLNAKLANSRKDFCHKVTTCITRTYRNIYVGNISSLSIVAKGIKSFLKSMAGFSPRERS